MLFDQSRSLLLLICQERKRTFLLQKIKMKTLLNILFISIIGLSPLKAQQIDTLELKKEVLSLKTPSSKKDYLKRLYKADQMYRGKQTNDSLDYLHLISISFFINEYGYPQEHDFGKYASAPRLIWIHNPHRQLDRICFPIILKGFLSRALEEKELRTYYLRGLYHDKFDDENYETVSLKELFTICEVNLDDKISIEKILTAKTEIDNFNQLKIVSESAWKAEDSFKTYTLNGQDIVERYEGETIKIIEKADGKVYLLKIYNDNSGESRELTAIGLNKYKLKGQQTDKYFEVLEDRVFHKDRRGLIKEYKREGTLSLFGS